MVHALCNYEMTNYEMSSVNSELTSRKDNFSPIQWYLEFVLLGYMFLQYIWFKKEGYKFLAFSTESCFSILETKSL